jgi:hypothetical protein
MRRFHTGAALATLLTAAAVPMGAQMPHVAGGAAFTVEHYDLSNAEALGIRSVTLLALPIGARVQVTRLISVDVASAYAVGTLRLAGNRTATLSGMTDTEVRASVALLDERLVVGATYFAPTGHASYTDDEALVAGVMASDLLPTRVSAWGSGGAYGLSASMSVPAGAFRLGGGAGFALASEYSPLRDQEFVYRPGNELMLHVYADRELGRVGRATLRLGTRQYSDDVVRAEAAGGQNIYQAGPRYEALASVALLLGEYGQAVMYAGTMHRGAGTGSERFGDLHTQDLMVAGAGARVPIRQLTMAPFMDVRLLRRSDGLNQGRLVGVGADVEVPLGAVMLVPSVRTRAGMLLPWSENRVSVRGLELGLMLRTAGGAR